MSAWADKIRDHLDRFDVYCYFNNDFAARAIKNSAELRDLVLARQDH